MGGRGVYSEIKNFIVIKWIIYYFAVWGDGLVY